jgi:hypothetical protein
MTSACARAFSATSRHQSIRRENPRATTERYGPIGPRSKPDEGHFPKWTRKVGAPFLSH